MQTKEVNALGIIERYDEDFFNCYLGHAISYFKCLDIPVELIFFKCFESIERIYDSFVIHERDRWHFPSPFFDLSLLRVRTVTRQYPTFEVAKPEILRLLSEGKAIFFSGDGYYIPHRVETYQIRLQPHNFMLTGYRMGTDGPEWFIQDHAWPDFFDWYPEAIIRDCYNLADYPFVHYINCFEIDWVNAERVDLTPFQEQFVSYLEMYQDDFTIYDKITSTLKESVNNFEVEISALQRVFFFLASSRELFGRFLVAADLSEGLVPLLKESKRLAFAIRGLLLRGHVTKRLDLDRVESLCGQLKEVEQTLLAELRRNFLQV